MDLTPKQQTSEAIRQAETILIITGQHPSVDQASAVVALVGILRKFGKNVTAIVSDNPPAATQMLDTSMYARTLGGSRDFVLKVDVSKSKVDKFRYDVEDDKLNIYLTPFEGSFAPSDVTFGYGGFHFDLAIVLGVPTRARIDKIYEQNQSSFDTIPMINLDFHRSNENYGAVNLIEPNASSLCEMLVALSESLQGGIIDAEIATALLMGIVGSTDRFTAAHTSPKSLTVAAQMMAAGAKQQFVVKALYRGSGGEKGGNDNRSGNDNRPNNDKSGGERRNDGSNRQSQAGQGVQGQPRGERQNSGEQPRQDRPAPARQPQEPARAEPTRQESRQAEGGAPVVSAPRAEVAPQVAPVAPVVAELDLQRDLEPIIQPSHIELSVAEDMSVSQPPTAFMAPPQVNAPALAPQAPAPTYIAQNIPQADFAAAAEMFNRPVVSSSDESDQPRS